MDSNRFSVLDEDYVKCINTIKYNAVYGLDTCPSFVFVKRNKKCSLCKYKNHTSSECPLHYHNHDRDWNVQKSKTSGQKTYPGD